MSQLLTHPVIIPGNDLLGVLRLADLAPLAAIIEELQLDAGTTIHAPGDIVDHCYLPTGAAMSSFLVAVDRGAAVETILIGREGALGGIVSQGTLPAYARASVLHGGTFLRIPLGELERVKRQVPAVSHLFSRYADCVMAQVFQSIACNAAHAIEQRAARWLSAAVDRIGGNRVTMTQEQLAGMMGIGRSYASRVLQRFKQDGLLRTRRGGIEVLDRAGLRARACTCDDRVQAHFDKVLNGLYVDLPSAPGLAKPS